MDASAAPILVATDLSPASGPALAAADARCRRSGAPLMVCHVMADDSSRLSPPFPQQHHLFPDEAEVSAARRNVRAQVTASTRRSVGDYDLRMARGVPSAAIVGLAKEVGAAPIVVGGGPRGLFARTVLGSTTEQLATLSPTSLLVVRDGYGTGRVLAPTDGGGASGRAVRVAQDEAETTHGQVIVVSDADPVETAGDQLVSLIVIDDASVHDDALDTIKRAPCSVRVIRGNVTF